MTYQETYEAIRQAGKNGRWAVIDTDMGEITLSAENALELFEEISPGEGFAFVGEVDAE